MKSGIYTITNVINKKVYVGYSTNLYKRGYEHIWNLTNNSHDNEHLQRAFNKYGKDNFIYEILEEYPENLLLAMEHYWCNLLNAHYREFGYNILPTNPNKLSSRHTEETKAKISKKNKGKKGQLGIPRTTKTKNKISFILRKNPHRNRKKLICNDTGKIFNSITEAKNHYNVGKTTISNIINGKFMTNKNNLNLSWKNL